MKVSNDGTTVEERRTNLDLEESVVVLSLLGDGLSSSLPLSDDSLGESRNSLDGGGSLGGEVLGVGLMEGRKTKRGRMNERSAFSSTRRQREMYEFPHRTPTICRMGRE